MEREREEVQCRVVVSSIRTGQPFPPPSLRPLPLPLPHAPAGKLGARARSPRSPSPAFASLSQSPPNVPCPQPPTYSTCGAPRLGAKLPSNQSSSLLRLFRCPLCLPRASFLCHTCPSVPPPAPLPPLQATGKGRGSVDRRHHGLLDWLETATHHRHRRDDPYVLQHYLYGIRREPPLPFRAAF